MKSTTVLVLLAVVSGAANAVPTLQLGIADGVYDPVTETVVSSGTSFTLSAYLIADSTNTLQDTYAISYAVVPKQAQTTPAPSLGSFTINGASVDVTADMVYGVAPLDSLNQLHDPGDLADHGIFDTYFGESQFKFSAANKSSVFNVQDHPSWGPQSGMGMFYQSWVIDVSGLDAGYAIHFDLYNIEILERQQCTTIGTGQNRVTTCVTVTDVDQSQFAPFSHDAQSCLRTTVGACGPRIPPVTIPEPGGFALVGLGLAGLAAFRRRFG